MRSRIGHRQFSNDGSHRRSCAEAVEDATRAKAIASAKSSARCIRVLMVCTAANAGSLCRWDVKIFSKLFQSGRARVGVSKSTQLFVTATNSKRPNGEHRTTKAAIFKITVPQNIERNSALADLCRRNCCASKAPGQPPAICELPS